MADAGNKYDISNKESKSTAVSAAVRAGDLMAGGDTSAFTFGSYHESNNVPFYIIGGVAALAVIAALFYFRRR